MPSDTLTPPLAKQLAMMLRARDQITVKEFGDELAGLFKVMFPFAAERGAHEEMELVGGALAVWLQLFVKSELERIRDGYH